MEKTVKLDSKTSIKLSNNIGWMMVYKNQFGRDIVPVLIPALNAVVEVALQVARDTDGKGVAGVAEVLRVLDTDTVTEAMIDLAGVELVDLINIVWAMAKAADDDIEEPMEWAKTLPVFPLDVIGPVVYDMVLKCMVSSKNLKRLQTALESLKPSPSMGS